jgi:hypothetical protein
LHKHDAHFIGEKKRLDARTGCPLQTPLFRTARCGFKVSTVRIDFPAIRLRIALEERAPERSGARPFADKELIMKVAFASILALAFSCSVIPAAHADSSLANQVYRAAARDGGQLSHVFVLTQGSDVTLVGWVSDFAQVPLLGRSAMSVQGVTSVNNLVTRGH